MSLWQRIFGASGYGSPSQRDPSDDRWYDRAGAGVGMVSLAGELVDENSALRVPTFAAACQVIFESIAQLPLQFFRRLPDGTKKRVDDHPLIEILRYRPNSIHTSAEFREAIQQALCIWRNAYVEIRPGRDYPIGELIPHHPETVSVELIDGRVWYKVSDGGRLRTLSDEEMLHFRVAPFERRAICGVPVLVTGRDVLGRALALQRYGGAFFRNASQAGGVFERDIPFKSQEEENRWLAKWRKARTGDNAYGIAILPPGMKFHETTVANRNAQFVETERETAVQVARLLNVQPHKVGILDKATFSNIEQQSLEFVVDTLAPWLVLWEQRIRADLIIGDPDLFAEFNVAGLLRGDIKARFDAYAQARQWGWLSVNEIRALENMNAIGNQGDVYLQPMNMTEPGALSAAAARPVVSDGLAELAESCRQALADLRAAQSLQTKTEKGAEDDSADRLRAVV